jgi:hypothetical protein
MTQSKAPRLESVRALSRTQLEVRYTYGRQFVLDLSGLVDELPAFAPLQDPAQWATAQVTDGGWTLEWACGASLDSDRVLEMAMEQAGLQANIEFRHWQDRHHFSLAGAADILGLTRRTVSQYRTGSRPIPKVVGLACRAIDLGAQA